MFEWRNKTVKWLYIGNLVVSLLNTISIFLGLQQVVSKSQVASTSDGLIYIYSANALVTSALCCALPTIVVPTLLKIKSTHGSMEALSYLNRIAVWIYALAGLVSFLALVFGKDFYAVVTKFPETTLAIIYPLLKWLPVLLLNGVLNEYLKSAILMRCQTVRASVSNLCSNLPLLVYILNKITIEDPESVVIAMVFGKIVQSFYLFFIITAINKDSLLVLNKTTGFNIQANTDSFIFWVANMVTILVASLVDYHSTGFGPGTLSGLSVASKLINGVQVALINPFIESYRMISLSGLILTHRKTSNHDISQTAQSVTVLLILISGWLVWKSEAIIRTFAGGNSSSYKADSIKIGAEALRIYALGLPFVGLYGVMGRTREMFGNVMQPCLLGTVGNLLILAITILTIDRFGVLVIPISKTLIDIFYFPFAGKIFIQAVNCNIGWRKMLQYSIAAVFTSLFGVFLAVYTVETSSTNSVTCDIIQSLIYTAACGSVIVLVFKLCVGENAKRANS